MQRTFHEVALPVHYLQVVVLWWEGNRKSQGKKTPGTTTRTINKLQPHVTAGPGIKPHP